MTYGSVDNAIKYLIVRGQVQPTTKQAPSTHAGGHSIDEILSDKVGCLGKILADIQGEIDKRQVLSSAVIERIYAHYFYVKKYLFQIDHWPITGNRAIEQRRSKLEEKLDTLLAEKRREQVLCFQDIANLKRDFWKWFKEYCDVAQRARMVLDGNARKPKNI